MERTASGCADPAPHVLPQDSCQAADADASCAASDARPQETCQQQQEQEQELLPSQATGQGKNVPGSWRQQAASNVRGRLKALAAKLVHNSATLLLGVLQAVYVYFAVGWLTGDPFHMLISPLQLGLVLVLVLPMPAPNLALLWHMLAKGNQPAAAAGRQAGQAGPSGSASSSSSNATSSSSTPTRTNSSSSRAAASSSSASWVVWYRPAMYWQQPRLRLAVILSQRVLPPLFAALSVGYITARFFELTSLRYWPMIGQYAFLGWKGFMLVLPFKLHLASSLLEWLLIYSTAVRVNAVYHSIPAASATSLQHLLASALCVVALPAAGVLWLEQGQRTRYRQMQQRLAAAEEQEEEELDYRRAHKQHVSASVSGAPGEGDSNCSSAMPQRSDEVQMSKAINVNNSSGSIAAPAAPDGSDKRPQQEQAIGHPHPSSSTAAATALLRQQGTDAAGAAMMDGSSTSTSARPNSSSSQALGTHSTAAASAPPSVGTMGRHLMEDIASSLSLAAAAPPLAAAAGANAIPAACMAHATPASEGPCASMLSAEALAKPAAAAASAPLPAGGLAQHLQVLDDGSGSGHSFLACLEQLSATQQMNAAHDAATDAASQRNAGGNSSSSNSDWMMAEVHSGLAALLGPDAASAVLGAAAEAASGGRVGPRPGDMPFYTSLAATMPVSVKVHTEHSNVGLLSPLLSSTLAGQLAPYSSAAAPLQLQTACFPGCVQLLGNIIALMPAAAGVHSLTAGTEGSSSSTARGVVDVQSSSFMSALLGGVTNKLKSVARAGVTAAGQLASDRLPAIDVIVGSAAASTTAAAAPAGGPAGVAPACVVSLQWCDMACLAAGVQQQLTLHLQLAGPQGAAAAAAAAAGECRLLAFNSSGVLLDEQAELQQTLRVSLPAQGAGLCHIALLAGPKPDTTADSDKGMEPSNAAPVAAAAPLLLLPLLVLPEEAAAEMQQAWQAAAAAAAVDESAPAGRTDDATGTAAASDGTSSAAATESVASDDELAAAWAGAVSSLTVDIAYVLSACSTVGAPAAAATAGSSGSAAAEQASPLPSGVSAVLCNLLQHLAAQGMFHTMQFLVQTATAATTGKAAPANDSATASRRSSSSDDSGDDADGADTSRTPSATSGRTNDTLSRAGSSAAPAAGMGGIGPGGSSNSVDSCCCELPDSSASTLRRSYQTWDSSKSWDSSAEVDEQKKGAAAAFLDASCHPGAEQKKPAAPECSSSASGKSTAAAAVLPLRQLLCGFADPTVESSFMTATFNSTTTLDVVTAVYCLAVGVGCWFAAGGKHSTPHQQQQQQFTATAGHAPAARADAAKQGRGSVMRVWSVAAVLVLSTSTSLAVWLLRLRVASKAKQLRCRPQQQQQQQQPAGPSSSDTLQAPPGKGYAAVTAAAAAGVSASMHALCAAAGFARQRLLALWIVQTVALNVLCVSGAVVTPGMMVRAWGLHGWAQNAACVLGLSVKAWMYQVPFHWFAPLMTLEVATHVYGSYVFGLQLCGWLAVRYAAALLLGLVVCAAHNVLGRKQFVASRGMSA